MKSAVLSVLVIDDCPEDRAMFVRYFEKMTDQNFQVIQTDSGEEGLTVCRREKPDCVLIDYQMPDLDGLEFLQELAADDEYRFLPVLMLTGHGDENVAIEAMKAGASDYLVKGKLTTEGLFRAVTRAMEKSRLLRTNEQQRREIERSYHELEQFAHTASHDLQAPVRRITKFLELLKMDQGEALNDRSKDYLARALKCASHMQGLIQDLLDYSLVGGADKAFQSVQLDEVLKEVLSQLDGMIVGAQATIEVNSLPTVLGNHTFLYQLFQNLIANAIKFRREDPPRIEISARDTGNTWVLTVKDNGVGIPTYAYDKIFGIFQRIDQGTQVEGTGIGLALCKKIVELHEGRIWVESTVNEGTSFHFTLPACLEHVEAMMHEAASAAKQYA